MEDVLWWKMTFDGSRPLTEDNLWSKMTFDARHLIENTLWWRTIILYYITPINTLSLSLSLYIHIHTTFDWTQTLMEEGIWQPGLRVLQLRPFGGHNFIFTLTKIKQQKQNNVNGFWHNGTNLIILSSFLGRFFHLQDLIWSGTLWPTWLYTKEVGSSEVNKQAQLGVPHSRIQVELGFILQAMELARFSILLKIQDIAKVFNAQN